MSRVPSRAAHAGVRAVASSPAVAGFRHSALAVAAAFALQAGAHAQSAPFGAVHGTATFQRDGNNLLVTTTNGAGHRSVINWQSFNVPGGSRTHFAQPDAASTSINRVLGGTRSDVMGTLSSNGTIILVNPSGIAIGANAMVDTAAFTASTLDLSEGDAINGRQRYLGGSAGISVGEGAQILARRGDVVLVGSRVQVERNAVVRAHGATLLAAGEKVEITGRGLEGIRLEVQAGNEVVNLGTLQGDAVGIFAQTLRHSGLVRAEALTTQGGRVVLKAAGDALVDGTVGAAGKGGKGGGIDVFGERVALLAGASLDASGARGGGSIRVGGDYQGRNAGVPNAKTVTVDAQASIRADATQQGDGGRVIVWSDGVTRMDGKISARGGAQGGNGGFAEVSSRGRLEYGGNADLRAPRGRTGTLLLDPSDVHIVVAAGTDPLVSYLLESTLESQLASASVIVQAGTGTPTPGGAGITLASDVDVEWSNNNVLGLQADGGVNLLGRITGTGANSAVSIQALGGGVSQGSGGAVTAFGLKVNAAGDVAMGGTNMVQRLSANSTLSGANGNVTFHNGRALHLAAVTTPYGGTYDGINAGTGNVMLNVQGGAVTQATTASVAANNLGVYADASVTLGGNNQVNSLEGTSSLLGGNGNFTFKNGKSLLVTQVTAGGGDVDIRTSAGSVTVGAPPTVTPPPAVQGNKVTIEARDNVVLQRDVRATGLATINAQLGTINQLTATTVKAAAVSMTAGSDINLAGSIVAQQRIGLRSDNGSITFGTLEARGDGSTTATADGGDVDLWAKGDIRGNSIETGGDYYFGTVGDRAGDGGNVSVTSDAGSIVLSGRIHASSGAAYDSLYEAGNESGVGGGAAGNVTLRTNGAGDIDVQGIESVGGSGTTATNGGIVDITAANGSVRAPDVYVDGGRSTGAGGLAGATGGKVSITAGGDIRLGDIHADGGSSESGVGGRGGEVRLGTGGSLVPEANGMFVVSAAGGEGGSGPDGNGKAGGQGGLVEITRNGGDLVANAGWFVDASGGDGGDAVTELGGTAGGVGGNGGDIKLHAPSGRVLLQSPLLAALGGAGGLNADDFEAASGANGKLRALGSSVDVTSDLILLADWINDSIVKVSGSSQVYGAGMFQNNGEVQLFDTAQLNPGFGLVNAGRLASFGSATMANLTLNTATGVVEVVAGSTLSTPSFLVNQGRVKVDGTLRVADMPALDLLSASVPTSGTEFTNDATGTLTGNGTIAVAGGTGTVRNFGTLAPGGEGSTGAMTLDASLVMESGSTYAADLLDAGSHDSLVVTGSAVTGGSFAVNYLAGAAVNAGDSFRMIQSGGLDASTLPGVDKAQLQAQASGNDLLLVATAAPPVAPPPLPGADQQAAVQQANNQVTTFADLFVKMSQEQEKNRIGKDDIVVTDTACTR